MLNLPSTSASHGDSISKYILTIGIFSIGLCIAVVGILIIIQKSNKKELEPCLSTMRMTDADQLAQGTQMFRIDVRGAVLKPGLFDIDPGSRVGDAIALAGGFTKDADGTFTQRGLNLAAQIKDGEKIYIPHKEEQMQEIRVADSTAVETGKEILISINTASQSELESLPGIGEKRALDIIAGRPYASLTELVEQKVITSGVYDKIQQLIRL